MSSILTSIITAALVIGAVVYLINAAAAQYADGIGRVMTP